MYLSSQYIDTGRPGDAMSAFNTAISQQREHSNAWINLGLLYEDLSQYIYSTLIVVVYIYGISLCLVTCKPLEISGLTTYVCTPELI